MKKISTVRCHWRPAFVTVGVSVGVAGNRAESIRVKRQELADNTFTIPASVLASAA
jgi:hypothetical protein